MNRAQLFEVALRGSVIAFIIISIFAIAGSGLLQLSGKTMDAFGVADGAKALFTG